MSMLTTPVGNEDHVQGLPDALVTLVEYGDYQCSYCGEAYPIVKRLQARLGADLRFVFRNFPLTEVHRHAAAAAQTAEAASLQNRFWEMHDMLYENQNALDDVDLLRYARYLELDIDQFKRDFSSEAVINKLQADFNGAIRSGANGTPTFFINSIRYEASYQYEGLWAALQAELERKRGIIQSSESH